MIKCHLGRLLGERRLKISDLSRMTGVNRNTLSNLYYDRAERVELEVIKQICLALQCEVGDLFELQRDDAPADVRASG